MKTLSLGHLKISTNLHMGEGYISMWASESNAKKALVIYHPEDNVRKKLIALVEKHHKLVEVKAVKKLSLPQFLRAICEAMRLPPARTGYDCFQRIRMNGTPFHVSDAHLLCTDHLGALTARP